MPACDVSDLQVAIVSKNEDKIRKVQGIARDKLNGVYDAFTDYLLTVSSQKKSNCLTQ
jgi:hypothetical protein